MRTFEREALTIADARDTLWTYTSADPDQLLVIERGWNLHHDGERIVPAC